MVFSDDVVAAVCRLEALLFSSIQFYSVMHVIHGSPYSLQFQCSAFQFLPVTASPSKNWFATRVGLVSEVRVSGLDTDIDMEIE